MDQRLVVAVLVQSRELQVAVQEQADPVAAPGQHDALVGRRARQDDGVLVEPPLRPGRQVVREHRAQRQHRERPPGLHREPRPPVAPAEVVAGPHRDEHVEPAEHERRPHQADLRHQPQREQQRRRQRAQVVERQDARDEVVQRELVLQDADEERNLQADEHPGGGDPAVQHDPKGVDLGEREEEHRRGEAADDAHQDLDLDEPDQQVAADVARQVRPDAHREQVDADDRRELRDAVAEEIAGDGAREQLVDETAGGDGEDRDQEDAGPRADGGARRGLRAVEGVFRGGHTLTIPRPARYAPFRVSEPPVRGAAPVSTGRGTGASGTPRGSSAGASSSSSARCRPRASRAGRRRSGRPADSGRRSRRRRRCPR